MNNLLKTPKKGDIEKYKQNFKPLERDSGKHADVFIVTSDHSPFSKTLKKEERKYAVKRQEIKDPKKKSDKAYREVRIFHHLKQLQEKNECFNFVQLKDWVKTNSSSLPFSDEEEMDTGKDEQITFMLMVLEYGGEPLANMKSMNCRQFISVVFQVIFALHIAQKYFSFVHHDLHSKNILLKKIQGTNFLV